MERVETFDTKTVTMKTFMTVLLSVF